MIGESTGTPCQNAIFVKRSLCTCGYAAISEHVPPGTIYRVHVASLQKGTLICGGCKAVIPVHLIWAEASEYGSAGWLIWEIFQMERPQ